MATKKAQEKKNKGGRPPEYQNSDELWEAAEQYFEYCEKNKLLPNKAGLAKYLDVHRDTLNDWEKKKQFSVALKKVRTWIEDAWVQRLGGNKPTGAIFYLKNAYKDDYKDRHAIGGDEDNPLTVGVVMLPQREDRLATNGETK